MAAPVLPPSSSTWAPGKIVAGKYRIDETLGKGGMGVVVRATHLQLGDVVALKFLHGHTASEPLHVDRFLREARAAARIKNEHVARVFDVGTLPTGEPFMVMEFLQGTDLQQLLKERGVLPIAEAINYVLQACGALAEAHQIGIVHRDLKPGNLFLARRADGSGFVKVLDFGISKVLDTPEQVLTATGDMLGSPPYMSPEQIRDPRSVDARSDIWALAAILFKLLTNRPPFYAQNASGTLAAIIADPAPSLRALRPDAPAELDAFLRMCFEKSPKGRPQSVADFARTLAKILDPNAPGSVALVPAPPVSTTEPQPSPPAYPSVTPPPASAEVATLNAVSSHSRGRSISGPAVYMSIAAGTCLAGIIALAVLRHNSGPKVESATHDTPRIIETVTLPAATTAAPVASTSTAAAIETASPSASAPPVVAHVAATRPAPPQVQPPPAQPPPPAQTAQKQHLPTVPVWGQD